ncbi:thiamine biosynthesis lipoprotein [Flavobacterium nitrogenifigens]|uniref:FAD:protein FMN transferase n=2 Tax=Flavobacterium TaxID=237 RepID=A0A7W7N8N8_9FLAO|nr:MULTISPECIES: FAD:protein FMN transferase [Flavobacterium]MBB4802607.1 thiamine biosynthesis lipoprotein [Flavobacterium nitrogenifigens]MBB6387565.1 thiamine biosynthesis lipoprotein [Flavobacterium notoginsengisoli]
MINVLLNKSLISIVFLIVTTTCCYAEWNRYTITGKAQGTTYSIVYYGKDSIVTKKIIDEKLMQLDNSLSLYKSDSKINQFNNSEEGIILDKHLLAVIKKALLVNKDTDGLFDITVYPLIEAWGFGKTKTENIPDASGILSLLNCINSDFIELKGNYLSKKKPCIKIDLDGIAQGYSVDILADLLEQYNIHNYVVELGGELRVKGTKQPSGEKMKIGIESPSENEFDNQPFNEIVQLNKGAITTSGSYRKFHESNGRKITHLINPKTGYPQDNELISVTVYAEDAITADAYDNALMLMGLEKALNFVEKRKNIAAYFIYKNNTGTISTKASTAFLKLKND